MPEVLEEARRNSVDAEKSRHKSTYCDVYVTCVDVHRSSGPYKLFWHSICVL